MVNDNIETNNIETHNDSYDALGDVTSTYEKDNYKSKYSNLGLLRKCLTLLLFIAIPIGVGLISSALTAGSMAAFSTMNKPPLAPPAMLFPIAWTVLYILMGLASYIIYTSDSKNEVTRFAAMFLYGTQLFFNFLWSIIFFNEAQYMGAFIWLLCLWGLVFMMLLCYRKISKAAYYLTIPYILWLTFAGYLNISIALLN